MDDDARRDYNRAQKARRRAALKTRTGPRTTADNTGVDTADNADTEPVENDECVRDSVREMSANFAADIVGRSRSEAKASAPTPPAVRVSALESVRADNNGSVRADNEWGDPDAIARRAHLHDLRAAARDISAIAACGLCDHNGFVVIDPAGPIPTVAFCSHLTTIAAPRVDLA